MDEYYDCVRCPQRNGLVVAQTRHALAAGFERFMWRFGRQPRFAMGESAMLASVLHADAMPLFHARVHGVRAEAGKLIHDVDVDGQKSSPWTYREFPRRDDLWGLNIHTSGEERDCIMAAIVDYHTANPLEKAAALAAARDQVIALQANAKCVRCAKSIITVEHAQLTSCLECGARYAFAV